MAITYPGVKHNLTATAAPGASDDIASGYGLGSTWINVLSGLAYVCIDETRGAARWQVDIYNGIEAVQGLKQALILPGTATRMALVERFEQRPVLEGAIDPGTAADPSQAEIDAIFAANRNFAVAGTNMTSVLVTQDAGRGGIRLTTAGASNDQAILQPRSNPSLCTRWALGFTTDLRPILATSFRLSAVTAVSLKIALALTNAHDLTTDADQVGLWWSSATGGNFLAIRSNDGTDTTVDTGVAPAAATEYRLEIELEAARTAVVRLNGVQVARTGALATAHNLIPFASIQALGAAAKSVDIRYMAASMEQAA